VKFHLEEFVGKIPDKTPEIGLWLSEECISRIKDNK
jgi:hypothetical protein